MALNWCFPSCTPPQCESCLGLPGPSGPPGPPGPPGPGSTTNICAASFIALPQTVNPDTSVNVTFTEGPAPLSTCSCITINPTDPTQLLITSPGAARIYVSGQLQFSNTEPAGAIVIVSVNGVPLSSATIIPFGIGITTVPFAGAFAPQTAVQVNVSNLDPVGLPVALNPSVVTVQILDGSCV